MESSSTATARHTCLKLEIPSTDPLFVKGTWFDTHFHLSVTDGLRAWLCNATEEEVQERAAQWDQPVAEYIELAERYLEFQQPGSAYQFVDAGDDHKRLSWTFEREGTKLEWRWKFQPSNDSRKITAGILDFLMDANINLSEEVVRKTQSFEKLKLEAEKCLEQSERFTNEKMEFESEIYAKFLGVLNSKKAKLRELRDQLSKQEIAGKASVDEEESTDKTESYHSGSNAEESEEEADKKITSSSKDIPAGRGRGRKRATLLHCALYLLHPVLRTIELLSFHHHFMRHRICFSWVSFLMTVNASPSTHISRKPISSAMVTACKHAFASA
ncbi:hypothetical protein V6Z11_A10G131100 [Gossypium hirsutum]